MNQGSAWEPTLTSLTLMHAPIPDSNRSNGLGVADETQPVALSKDRVALRDEDGEASVYQRNQAHLWQVDLMQRTANEDR